MLKYFISLCLLQSGPADAPRSLNLSVQTLLAYLSIGWLISMLHLEFYEGLLSSLIDMVLLIAMTGGLLAVRGYTARLQQTLTALMGAGILLGILALPLLLWLDTTAQQTGLSPRLASLLLIGLMMWSIAVTAHIMRQALSVTFTVGVLVAVIYALVSIQVMNFLFSAT